MMNKGKIPSEVTIAFGSVKKRIPVNHLFLLAFLALLVLGALARDLTHRGWGWMSTPKIANIQQMSRLKKSGIEIPGAKRLDHRKVRIGEGEWSAQIVESADGSRITVLLKPQVYYKDQPEVEWSDVQSIARWKSEGAPDLVFPSPSGGTVTARFYRAWQTNTFAVVQWYAWLGGGHHDNAAWYWQDQRARLKRQRTPWIAVSIHIPLEPTKKIDTVRPLALDLARKIQRQLEAEILSRLSAESTDR
jgi:cyanoexosortase B-associated protein